VIFEWLSAAPSEAAIDTLDPSIRVLADALLRRAAAQGVSLAVTDGYRSWDDQERLYKQGRETPGPIVTGAKPGYSWHQYSLAFDVAKLQDGKRTWPADRAFWERIGAIGAGLGLKWGGSFGDLPHFEYHPGLSFEDAMNGKRPPVPSVPPEGGGGSKSGWVAVGLFGALAAAGLWLARGKLW